MASYNIISLNVNGLRNTTRRKSLFRKFKESSSEIICLQETYITEDVADQWKREWGGELIFSTGTARSRGQVILFKKDLEAEREIIHIDDRVIIVKIIINSISLYICNAYAPNQDHDVIHFLENLSVLISNYDPDKLIICGDFNTVMDNNMDIISGEPHTQAKVDALQNFTHVNNIFDIYRIFNNSEKEFTWSRVIRGETLARRLDYMFVNEAVLNDATEASIISFPFTDHRGVLMKLKSFEVNRGPGYWKMNNSLLKEKEYLNLINDLIDSFEVEMTDSSFEADIKWEILKKRVKEETINYSRDRALKRKNKSIQFSVELDALDTLLSKEPNREDLIKKKQSLLLDIELLEQDRIKSAHIRSKEKWIQEGEKNSRFFLNLEKAKANSKLIPSLELENNQTITDQNEILKAQTEYYEKLYKSNEIESDHEETLDLFLDGCDVPRLDQNQSNSCEGRVTLEELSKGLKELKNDSSPGLDGITAEFLKVFWCRLGHFLVDSFNCSFQKGSLSFSQRSAVITLIHKGKDLPRNKLNNWRPISLTNSDYKVLAKTLALRLMNVIDSVVDLDQCAYIKNRSVSNNLRLIDDVIDYLKTNNKPGILLAIDFTKAFDSISRKFMIKAFERFGFGQDFVKWVGVLMCNNKSSIGYNGWVSGSFSVEKGIRQGCPFSPLAFIIALEYLAIRIRKHQGIKGIQIGNQVEKIIKILLYADDVTLFLKDKDDLKQAIEILENFKRLSGLSMNKNKTEVMYLGSNRGEVNREFNLKWVEEIKILGVYFSNQIRASQNEKNWKDKIEKVKRIIKSWEKRNLGLIGKICIIKSFLSAQFVYILKSIGLPENVLTEINRLFFRFLWRKKDCNKKAYEKVKRKVMINNIDLGGLSMIDMHILQKSFKLEWVVKLFRCKKEEKWAWVAKEYLIYLSEDLQLLNSTVGVKEFKGLDQIADSFWKTCITVWLNYNSLHETKNTYSECIFNNNNIRYQHRVVYYKEWVEKRVVLLKDIIDINTGRILSYDELVQKIGYSPNLWLQYRVVHTAVNNYLRNYPIVTQNIDQSILLFNDMNFVSARMFRQFISEIGYSEPCAKAFWLRKLNISLDKSFWALGFDVSKESRLRELHFKVLHNIYPTNILLSKLGITNNTQCSYCPGVTDFIEHFFFECPKISRVWNSVESRFFQKYSKHIHINLKEALLGMLEKDGLDKSELSYMNHLILIAKMSVGIFRYNKPIDIQFIFETECNVRKV